LDMMTMVHDLVVDRVVVVRRGRVDRGMHGHGSVSRRSHSDRRGDDPIVQRFQDQGRLRLAVTVLPHGKAPVVRRG